MSTSSIVNKPPLIIEDVFEKLNKLYILVPDSCNMGIDEDCDEDTIRNPKTVKRPKGIIENKS